MMSFLSMKENDKFNPAIPLANAQLSMNNIIDYFKNNQFVDESEIQSFLSRKCEYGDFVLYYWSDNINMNKLIVALHRGERHLEFVTCALVDGYGAEKNILLKTQNSSLIQKWNEYSAQCQGKNIGLLRKIALFGQSIK